jgi:hypothetical protein
MSTEPWPLHGTAPIATARISWKSCNPALPIRQSDPKKSPAPRFVHDPVESFSFKKAKPRQDGGRISNAIPLPRCPHMLGVMRIGVVPQCFVDVFLLLIKSLANQRLTDGIEVVNPQAQAAAT